MYKQKPCRYGNMLFNLNDQFIGRSMDEYGEWSQPEPFLFSQIVRPGDVVIEAGANIGSHTVALSGLVGEQGRVHAFEPQQHVFQILCANVALNEQINVRTYQVALGEKEGVADFPVVDPRHPNNFGAASFLEAANLPCEPAQVRTLDSYAFDRADFIKADVEGYESQVLDGAIHTIRRHRPVLYLEYANSYGVDNSRALIKRLDGLGYDFWYYITPLYNAQNFFQNSTNHFPGIWSFDLLCVPSDKGRATGLLHALTEVGRVTDPEAWRQARFERKA